MTEQELQKLEQEIKLAQNKLDEIMQAINREKISLETIQKDYINFQNLFDVLNTQIEELSKDKEVGQKELQVVSDKLLGVKKDLDTVLNSISSKEEEYNTLLITIQTSIDEINKKKEEHELKVDALKGVVLSLETTCAEKEESCNKIINDLIDQIDSRNNIIIELDKKISEKNTIISTNEKIISLQTKAIEENTKEFAGYQEQISVLLESKKGIENFLITLEEEKTEKQNEIKKLEEMIIPLKEEIENINREKFNLLNTRDELNAKERFIKYKYEQAGIKYE